MTTHPATRAAKPAASGRAWGTPAQGTPSRQAWGHLRQWAQPQTLRRSLFLLGQEPFLESSPSEPRSTHCWEGAPEPAPRGAFPEPSRPCEGQHGGSGPVTERGCCLPSPTPIAPTLPEGHAPFREPRGRHVPKEGWRGCHFHPPSPTGPGTKRAPTCLWREQMTQRSGQRSRSGKCPEPITGSRALRSGGSSAVTYATRSPLALPGLSAAACALGQLPAYRFPPLLPPESPLRGWGPAG